MLDQNEVDALLSAVDTGEVQEAQASTKIFTRSGKDPNSLEVRGYDFKRPERVGKDQMLALQTLHEAFARNFGASLSGFMRTIVEVRVATCEQMTYGEFIGALPNPTSFNLVQSDSLEGQMCLEISPLIIYPIIDRLLGGTNQDLFIPQRPMTPIEQRLISNVIVRGLASLGEAWESVRPMKFEVVAQESNPQLVQIVPPNEVVMVIGLELRMGTRAGTMNLCIPYNVIEPVMDELSSQSWFAVSRTEASKAVTARIEQNLDQAGLEVSAVLAETTITLRDFAEMQPGDVIVTEQNPKHPAMVTVAGEPKFQAMIGQHRGKRAIRVVAKLSPGARRDRVVADAHADPTPA